MIIWGPPCRDWRQSAIRDQHGGFPARQEDRVQGGDQQYPSADVKNQASDLEHATGLPATECRVLCAAATPATSSIRNTERRLRARVAASEPTALCDESQRQQACTQHEEHPRSRVRPAGRGPALTRGKLVGGGGFLVMRLEFLASVACY